MDLSDIYEKNKNEIDFYNLLFHPFNSNFWSDDQSPNKYDWKIHDFM